MALNEVGHRECLPRAGYPEERLVEVTSTNRSIQRSNGCRLIACRLIARMKFKAAHLSVP